ncbi:uncharacterized protein BDW47DRAFT_36008 [Aspergillus candidus]|uniref:Uncharacterized protein n=1 Tax=Aspergillus candidus TaxID=41067 RepID=A0A2I2FAR6_ASPCN|nr:hypothetical protein BDW47DRAFT_36008 [Aspergillus candidus]PLB37709.1 hypothetical protein BDW47DRAFT_36008 [Aspergillus candidus]
MRVVGQITSLFPKSHLHFPFPLVLICSFLLPGGSLAHLPALVSRVKIPEKIPEKWGKAPRHLMTLCRSSDPAIQPGDLDKRLLVRLTSTRAPS